MLSVSGISFNQKGNNTNFRNNQQSFGMNFTPASQKIFRDNLAELTKENYDTLMKLAKDKNTDQYTAEVTKGCYLYSAGVKHSEYPLATMPQDGSVPSAGLKNEYPYMVRNAKGGINGIIKEISDFVPQLEEFTQSVLKPSHLAAAKADEVCLQLDKLVQEPEMKAKLLKFDSEAFILKQAKALIKDSQRKSEEGVPNSSIIDNYKALITSFEPEDIVKIDHGEINLSSSLFPNGGERKIGVLSNLLTKSQEGLSDEIKGLRSDLEEFHKKVTLENERQSEFDAVFNKNP